MFADKKERPIYPPQVTYPVADTHCHVMMLDDAESGSGDRAFFKDAADALIRSAEAGVTFIVSVLDPCEIKRDPHHYLASCEDIVTQANQRADHDLGLTVRYTCGCHPHNAQDFDDAALQRLKTFLDDDKVVALGEIGLDYHYDFSPRDVQRRVFKQQLELAHEKNLPVVLHLREAHDDAYEILKSVGIPPKGACLHCFNLGPDELKRFEDLGCMFSIGGPVTFGTADDLRESMKVARLDRLMTETDAPFMAPKPLRGTRCEPAMTLFSLQKIIEIRQELCGEDPDEVAQVLYNNARSFFADKTAPSPEGKV